MALLKWTLIVLLVGYLGVLVLLYVMQRALMYFPESERTAPAAAGLPAAQEILLDTADGEKVVAWHVPPRGDQPVVLYLHGNGGALRNRADRFRALTADGTGLVAVDYRGYGGSTGHPSETGLLIDAQTAYAFAAARYPVARIAVWGESLGTGVAVGLAAVRPVGRLVLEAPFTVGGRSRGPSISVRAGALAHARPVPLRSAHRRGRGTPSGAARRTRHHRADRIRRAAIRARPRAQAVRAISARSSTRISTASARSRS